MNLGCYYSVSKLTSHLVVMLKMVLFLTFILGKQLVSRVSRALGPLGQLAKGTYLDVLEHKNWKQKIKGSINYIFH